MNSHKVQLIDLKNLIASHGWRTLRWIEIW